MAPKHGREPRADDAGAEVLITAAFPTVESFEGTLTVHRLWEIGDVDLFFEETGRRIRGVAAGGRVKIDHALLARMPNLEIIANFGVGYDRIDVARAWDQGIIVTNTPHVLTEEVADLALGLLIATTRRLVQADRYVRSGLWPNGEFPLSDSLRNRVIGLVGLGRIGKAIARRCAAMDLDVCYTGRSMQAGVPYRYFASLEELTAAVDVLVVTVPGGPETDQLIDGNILDALGPDGILINVSRGSVVDEQALLAALRTGRMRAAGLDVFQYEPSVPNELFAMENVVLLPHIGSATWATRRAMGQLVLDNLKSWFSGRGPLTPVPETPHRFAVDFGADASRTANSSNTTTDG